MSRAIKFRAWDEKNKRMLYDVQKAYDNFDCNDDDAEKYGDGYTYKAPFNFRSFGELIEDNPPLMQFTGLKDKSGREIYEGDIIQYNAYIHGPVKFENSMFLVKGKSDELADLMVGHINMRITEVVGNIHENPELLTAPQARGK